MLGTEFHDEDTFDTSENGGSPEDNENKPMVKYAYNKNKSKKPRRNKSAFILFSIDARVQLKSGPNEVNSNEMMVKLAEMWKNLDEKEKNRYTSQAKNDKIRYLKELENFWKENPEEMLQNKTKKNHVKKPCSGYALYLKEVKEEVKVSNPNLKMADILKIVSERWKTLDEKKKEVYLQEADRAKEVSRALLGENMTKNNVDKSVLLKKKKARHINEVKKQVKMDSSIDLATNLPAAKPQVNNKPVMTPPVPVPEKMNTNVANNINNIPPKVALPPKYNPQLLLESLINQTQVPTIPQIIKPEPIKMPSNPGSLLSRGPFVPQFRPFSTADLARDALAQNLQFISQPTLVKSQKSIELSLSNQKSGLAIPFPKQPSQQQTIPKEEESTNAASLLQLLDKTVKSSSELLMDLLNFDSNPGRVDSTELINATSLRINSNPFASTIDAANRAAAPKFSRAEMFNNAILSALGTGGQDESKAEEDCTNPILLALSMNK